MGAVGHGERACRLGAALALTCTIVACDAPPGSTADAGEPEPDAGATAPAAPTPPSWECPGGWRAIADAQSGTAACDPWPAAGRREDCPPGEAHFPGSPSCEPVGTACPADGWPAELPPDREILYVDDDAPPGGDGRSRATALRSIASALAIAPADGVVAIATGDYDEGGLRIGRGQALVGACPAGTRLTSSEATESDVVVDLVARGATLRNLSIDAPARLGIGLFTTDALVEGVVVHAARSTAVIAARGTLTLRNVLVTDVAPARDGSSGRAIEVQDGAEVLIERAVVLRARENAILVTGPTGALTARDLAVIDTLPLPDGSEGRALAAQHTAHVVLERAVFERAREHAILAGASAVIEARDLVVREALPRHDGTLGRGVQALSGARITIDGTLIEGVSDVAVVATDADTTVELRDALIRDVLPTADGSAGRCVSVQGAARAVLERVSAERCREVAIAASDPGTTLVGRDVTVRSTVEVAPGTHGRGVSAHLGASVSLERAAIERCHEIALGSSDPGSRIDAVDLSISDALPRGLDGDMGVGVWAQIGSTIEISRARIERTRVVGAAALQGARLTLDGVLVSGVEAAACAAAGCEDSAGFGVAAMHGGTVRVTGFEIARAAVCGVVVGGEGDATAIDLERGVVASAPVGACVQSEGFDTSRLRREVQYRDVGIPLQATSYALPDAL